MQKPASPKTAVRALYKPLMRVFAVEKNRPTPIIESEPFRCVVNLFSCRSWCGCTCDKASDSCLGLSCLPDSMG